MQELLRHPVDIHVEPHGADAQHTEQVINPNVEERAAPGQETVIPELAETSRQPRLRQVIGRIALRWRPGRTSRTEATTASEIYDSGVDEFGLPTHLTDTTTMHDGAEYWSGSLSERKGESVKDAPRFLEMVDDITRTNPIEYVAKSAIAVGTQTQGRETAVASEHDTLVAIRDFLNRAANYTNTQGEHSLAPLAASMTENLTFVGEREYNEAVAGIAERLRQRLQSAEAKQICISTTIAEADDSVVKSSDYLLDNIIKHFSDEELAAWKDRLVSDPAELTADPKDVSIILLDDWTISGAQLKHSAQNLIDKYPDYRNKIEVQLVAASGDRIRDGLRLDDEYSSVGPIPVNAYYAAHAADKDMASHSGAHITGAHCAVDYDFNDQMSSMAITMGEFLPPGTNIVRPYRKPNYRLTQLQRLHSQHELVEM